jgi:hypothetical protein
MDKIENIALSAPFNRGFFLYHLNTDSALARFFPIQGENRLYLHSSMGLNGH